MQKYKEKAFELRRSGMSYKQIRTELGIATSTLAGWFKNEPWSQDIKRRLSLQISWSNPKSLELLVKANKERWRQKHEEYRNTARREFDKYKSDPLFLAGIMLYWGEGDKSKLAYVRLTNSEPDMIRIFNLFLSKVLGISSDRINAWLLLYPDLVDPVQKNFWAKATGLSIDQFKKSIYIKGRHPAKRLSYGVCTIFVNSRALKERVLTWIDLYKDFLKSHGSSLENNDF